MGPPELHICCFLHRLSLGWKRGNLAPQRAFLVLKRSHCSNRAISLPEMNHFLRSSNSSWWARKQPFDGKIQEKLGGRETRFLIKSFSFRRTTVAEGCFCCARIKFITSVCHHERNEFNSGLADDLGLAALHGSQQHGVPGSQIRILGQRNQRLRCAADTTIR